MTTKFFQEHQELFKNKPTLQLKIREVRQRLMSTKDLANTDEATEDELSQDDKLSVANNNVVKPC